VPGQTPIQSHEAELAAGEQAERVGDLGAAAAAFSHAAASDAAEVRARALVGLGRVAWRQTRLAEALEHYAAARFLAGELQALDILAEVENGVGAVHYARGEYDRARIAFRASFALTSDDRHRAKVALNLGVLANIAGDHREAQTQYQRSRRAFRRVGDRSGEAMAVHNLAMLRADRREWDDADRLYDECLTLAEAAGNRQLIADTLLNHAEVFCGTQRYEAAVALSERAMTLHDELGNLRGRGEALRWRGHAQVELGDFSAAGDSLAEAHGVAKTIRNALLEAEVARELGSLAERKGDPPAAAEWYRQSLALFEKLGAAADAHDLADRLERIASTTTS
jgi:tetratricopeptide (TPR) repeat protein